MWGSRTAKWDHKRRNLQWPSWAVPICVRGLNHWKYQIGGLCSSFYVPDKTKSRSSCLSPAKSMDTARSCSPAAPFKLSKPGNLFLCLNPYLKPSVFCLLLFLWTPACCVKGMSLVICNWGLQSELNMLSTAWWYFRKKKLKNIERIKNDQTWYFKQLTFWSLLKWKRTSVNKRRKWENQNP